jgi:hypothetical protein
MAPAREIAQVATEGAGLTLGALLSGVATYLACSYGKDAGFARWLTSPLQMPGGNRPAGTSRPVASQPWWQAKRDQLGPTVAGRV